MMKLFSSLFPSLRGGRKADAAIQLRGVCRAGESNAAWTRGRLDRHARMRSLAMTIGLYLLVLLAAPFASSVAHAEPEAVVDLAEDFIPVTEDFDGARMTVFGALRSSKSDIIVVFEGPPAKALIRAKIKQYGIWVNDNPQTLEPVPSFYAVLSSQPLNKLMKPDALEKLALGLNALSLNGAAGEGLKLDRAAKGLYIELPAAVKIRDKKLFRADIYLPPNVPVGTYKAMIYEVRGGAVAASRETSFKIEPIGMASMIRRLAVEHPILYAALAIILVLLIGGVSAHLFRKAS
ncbi:MAG TPA: hypothetical protein DCY07_06390 [Rhodospirillaceae bacterium]|nr:hypothetical protein [Rhodospirillaceae bacterium]